MIRVLRAIALGLFFAVVPTPLGAQPVEVPPTWGGDLWSRPRLTGSWWGLRDELGKKGVVFDTDLLLTPQGVLSGGRDTGAEFWGNAEYTLNVDTGKLGLWPGGFFRFSAISAFGDSVVPQSGALAPVNTSVLLPRFNDPTTALTNATFTQFLSEKFGVFVGKIFTLDSGAGEFAGNYRTQFQNTSLVLPLTLALVPISAYGGGVVVLPWQGAVLSALALDPSGTPTNNDVSEAFDDGVTLVASGQFTIKPFGLVGHQNVGAMWSNKARLSLIQDPSNVARAVLQEQFPLLQSPGPLLRRIIERFFPELLAPSERANREKSTWAMFYGFDQYLWQPGGDPKRGIGIFFNFGASDGEANPIKYIFSTGIGGKGIVPGRPHDTFGIGWARTEFSDNLLPTLRRALDLGLDHEDAIEMFYNAAITRWVNVSLDLQVIEPGLKKMLGSNGTLQNVDTAVVGGIRMYIRF